ncbi:MAG: serine/threonine-protein phosphatase [Lachnospiraceae bacterium]|nr:serine/threonine-protein phosphatase [Lachnospiraceae bacterium]
MNSFTVSVGNMVNIIIISAGLGICTMIILLLISGSRLRREVTRYFILFFGTITLYVGSHLARQLMEGQPGNGIQVAINAVTFLEFVASGFMAWLFSQLTLYIANPDRHQKLFSRLFTGALIFHIILMIVNLIKPLCFYFDSGNIYHRAPGYILSNLAHLFMLLIDTGLMLRWKDRFRRQTRIAFWIYIIAPVIAIVIQVFIRDVQFIILVTIGAAVYMSGVIMQDLVMKYEQQRTDATRIGTELSLATNIQTSMLPHIFPAFPMRSEFDIYASMDPAKEVGGDFYDYFLIDDDHLGMVIADVSGKGVPAALFMMASKIILQSVAIMGYSPAEVLKRTNDSICSNNEAEMFVTVWLGILELPTGKLTMANAGHEYPTIRQPGGEFELFNDKHGFVIGGMEGMSYKEQEIQMQPGSKLFVYTDGVAEATNSENEMYGTERMINALNIAPDASPEQILKNVRADVDSFVKEAEQFDDLTMLCIEYKGRR